jgi:translocator protein
MTKTVNAADRRARTTAIALRPWQIVVVLMTLLTIVVNVLANALPIAGRATGEISDAFPSLVTPAGYVFSIWGLIYIGLVAYAVWQALPAQAANPRARALAAPVIVAHAANALWIFAWHNLAIGLSLLLMLVLLGSLMVIYVRLRGWGGARGAETPAARPARGAGAPRSRTARGAAAKALPLTTAERLVTRGTFSVYLGWITVATVANVTIWLIDLGFVTSFLLLPAVAWAVIAVIVAAVIGIVMLRRFADLAYAAVLVWAFVGIVVMQSGTPLVAAAAVVGAVALLFQAALAYRGTGYTART